MKTALTIAGSDSSGGAGIQADIKTMTANGVFALCAVTALTAQNTTGVTDIFDSTPHFLAEQLDAVFTDIFPDAVKIGMVSSAELIETIAAKLKEYGAKHIVVDPVMVATSGAKLLRDDAVTALCEKLLPLAEVLTPNIPEAEILSGMTIQNAADMERAAQTISEKYGCAVLCKGGHQINDADDLLITDDSAVRGYRENSSSGAIGAVWRNTLRLPLNTDLPVKLTPRLGLDNGWVKHEHGARSQRLSGASAGLNLSWKNVQLDFDYQRNLNTPTGFRQEPEVWLTRLSVQI